MRKVLGTKNPSDMMTKNVPGPTMELYLDMLNLWFSAGRAKIAQQLHSVGEIPEQDPLANAHPCVGARLLGKIGDQCDVRVRASSGGDVLLSEAFGGSGADR